MDSLEERVKLSQLVYGKDLIDFYRNNTLFMYDKYSKSDDDCQAISKEDIREGGFYHLYYMDDSNWMRWSPIFCCDWRKFSNMIIVLGVNFNFIPLELRSRIFDKFITEKNFEKNEFIEVNFKGMYSELLKYGFEYAIQEYNVAQIKQIHHISLELLPRFLYSSYPKNTYDPKKLMEIWQTKLETKEERHQEMTKAVLSEFYDVKNDMSEKYDVMKDHIDRLQKSLTKYGKP